MLFAPSSAAILLLSSLEQPWKWFIVVSGAEMMCTTRRSRCCCSSRAGSRSPSRATISSACSSRSPSRPRSARRRSSGSELKLDVGSAADKGGVGALAQLGGISGGGGGGRAVLNFRALDALFKLVTILVEYFSDSSSANTHLALLHRALVAVLRALCQKHCRHPCSAMRGDSRTRSSAPLRAPVPGVELLVRRALHGKAK
ncbi:hypothetical protein T492DRAFT_1105144 [Pavlovales sp. CCMP2436]|nr:hypothetical protein T492DRAFT_1105144 [Pavlovales sp. CCMP2436]